MRKISSRPARSGRRSHAPSLPLSGYTTRSGVPLVDTARKRAVTSLQFATWCAPSSERHHVAWCQLAPFVVGADARASQQDDEHLLLGQVVVVRIGGLAGLDLPDARSETLRGELPAEPCAQRAEAGVLAALVEIRLEDVRHGERLRADASRSSACRKVRS